MQVMFTHAPGAPHCPLALQVWTALPAAHCVVFGMQATQTLFKQTGVVPEQELVVCHVPVLSHVCIELPMHLVWPTTQVPAHASW
jgi:hypothetical protein